MKLGASFSHPHLIGLNIDPLKAIKEFKNLGLSWIRLGCYWNEIEKEQGKFNFSKLDLLIEYCEKNNLKVVLTIGMKAPRNPEYYIPNWLLKKLHLRKLSKIKLADIVGFDLYFRHPIPYMKFFKKYIGPLDSKVKIKRIVKDVKKQGKDFC